jgi:hypothetical protein
MTHQQAELCRVQVWYGGSPLLNYRAERSVADRFAEAVREIGTEVTIDEHFAETLRRLPCEQLWL